MSSRSRPCSRSSKSETGNRPQDFGSPARLPDIGGGGSGAMTSLGSRAGTFFGAAAGGALAGGWFEAGWVRLRTFEVGLPGLPDELAGLRIAHLSDFHLGVPSRGIRAVEAAVDWVAERRPDLVAITGDLVSRPSAEPRLRELLGRLGASFSVLGNQAVEHTRA